MGMLASGIHCRFINNSINPYMGNKRRPDLAFRKSKSMGMNVEDLKSTRVPVPKLKGEAVFGIYPVWEALRIRRRTCYGLYIKDTVRDRSSQDMRISDILRFARELCLPIRRLTHPQFDKITDFQLHNVSCVVGAVSLHQGYLYQGIFLDASPLPFSRDILPCLTSVFLDNVLDPGNIGAIARTCLFFAADNIGYAKGRGPNQITPSMSKASCGALECFPILQVPSFDHYHKVLSSEDTLFIGTSDINSATKYGKTVIPLSALKIKRKQKVTLVLGDEGRGISEYVMSHCNIITSIPMPQIREDCISSLNVSIVAGLILHHIASMR